MRRVSWLERRHGEPFFVVAQELDGCWRFEERSSWEPLWYPAPATRHMLRRARRLAKSASAATETALGHGVVRHVRRHSTR